MPGRMRRTIAVAGEIEDGEGPGDKRRATQFRPRRIGGDKASNFRAVVVFSLSAHRSLAFGLMILSKKSGEAKTRKIARKQSKRSIETFSMRRRGPEAWHEILQGQRQVR